VDDGQTLSLTNRSAGQAKGKSQPLVSRHNSPRSNSTRLFMRFDSRLRVRLCESAAKMEGTRIVRVTS
jgi:hypothetical protein